MTKDAFVQIKHLQRNKGSMNNKLELWLRYPKKTRDMYGEDDCIEFNINPVIMKKPSEEDVFKIFKADTNEAWETDFL